MKPSATGARRKKTPQRHSCQALVVGSGATAALTALLLHRLGLHTVLLGGEDLRGAGSADTDPLPPTRSIALSRRSIAVLKQLEVWPQLLAQSADICRMEVWEASAGGLARFARSSDAAAGPLARVIGHSLLEQALYRQAAAEGIQAMPGDAAAALTANPRSVTATLASNRQWQTDLLIAADGADSPLRQLAGLQTTQRDTGQTAIACCIRTELPHDSLALQVFLAQPAGPMALLPLHAAQHGNDGHWRSLIWSVPTSEAPSMLALSDREFAARCAAACEGAAGQVHQVGRRLAFAVRHRRAEAFYRADLRLALVGDSGQNIHPLAGQGLNLAIADAQTLAQCARHALQNALRPGDDRALRRYHRRRLAERLPAQLAIDGFLQLFSATNPTRTDGKMPRWLRGAGMRAATRWTLPRLLLQSIADGAIH